MPFFNQRNKYGTRFPEMHDLRDGLREDEIARLEEERLEIITEIEKIMKRYAKISGNRRLGRRAAKVGKAPNDWQKRYL